MEVRMPMRYVLVPILALAALAGCSDAPLPVAADGRSRPAPQLAGSSTVDGFTITVMPPLPGGAYLLPRRILDDGTVYGQSENSPDGIRPLRWTPGGATVEVPAIPPVLAGVDRTTGRPGQYFYDDGRVRYRVGRECGHPGLGDPDLPDPGFCDYDFVIGTYATSSCFPNSPEPGIYGAGFAVNGRCHVLAARRAFGAAGRQALDVYLWRPETGYRRILEDPVPDPYFQDYDTPLLNGEDQAVVVTRPNDGNPVTTLWRPDFGRRLLPLPAVPTGTSQAGWVVAMNELGQMAGNIARRVDGAEVIYTVVWTPPPVNRATYPRVDASPLRVAVTSTYLGSRRGFYTQYYKIAAPGGAGPWSVRVDWGDGTARNETRTRAGVIEAAIHNYTRTGTFTVRVTVVDARGRSGGDTRVLTVRP
jgi:hypothetical protein